MQHQDLEQRLLLQVDDALQRAERRGHDAHFFAQSGQNLNTFQNVANEIAYELKMDASLRQKDGPLQDIVKAVGKLSDKKWGDSNTLGQIFQRARADHSAEFQAKPNLARTLEVFKKG
jgi:hypothetical protein